MQIYDSLLVVVYLFLIFSMISVESFIGRKRPWLTAVGLVIFVLHILLEGARWQMVPVYITYLVAVLLVVTRVARRRDRTRRMGGGIFGISIFLSLSLSYLFPVFKLPEPSGQYSIGITDFHLVDKERPENRAHVEAGPRELMVTAWYPSASDAYGSPEPYWPNASVMSDFFVKGIGASWLPSFIFSHLGNVRSHSVKNVSLAKSDTPFPVLIFSHGLGSYARQSTVLMEELASHGYVVLSVNHTYWSMVSIFPDGDIVGRLHTWGDEMESESQLGEALYQELILSTNNTEKRKIIDEMIRLAPKTVSAEREGLDTWSADQRLVMDELERWGNEKDNKIFGGRLDLNRIGVFGMSYGGKAAIETCAVDRRCKAGINLDGFSLLSPMAPPQTIPFMHMNSEKYRLTDLIYETAIGPGYLVSVGGSEHMDYSDLSLFGRLVRDLGLVGSIGGKRMQDIVNVYVRSFFDKHLRMNRENSLKNLSGQFPEVTFHEKNGRSSSE